MNTPSIQTIAVVTGSRAEFGLLEPVLRALDAHPALESKLIVTGVHLIGPNPTVDLVRERFRVDAEIPMQHDDEVGRDADARAFARGTVGFTSVLGSMRPDAVLVLGDRIEPFAAASVAAVAGIPIAHIHGGDRAEGVADESMRHAISKLAHVHFPASEASRERLIAMGEHEDAVHAVGSPGVDSIASIEPLTDEAHAELGSPDAVLLHHPTGLDADTELLWSTAACAGLHGAGRTPLVLAPNADPGTESVRAAIEQACETHGWATTPHLPREVFLGLLKRLAATGGVLVGNSSAGLLEAGAVGVPVVNLGPRQSGRERWHGVTDVEDAEPEVTLTERVSGAIHASASSGPLEPSDRFGDGRASERIAEVLASTELGDPSLLRKRNRY